MSELHMRRVEQVSPRGRAQTFSSRESQIETSEFAKTRPFAAGSLWA